MQHKLLFNLPAPLKERPWLIGAIIAILLGVVPILVAGLAAGTRQSLDASARYGITITDRLAASALDPVIAGDLIALSVLVREYKALPDVTTAAVYGADDRLLAAADGAVASPARLLRSVPAPVHIQAIRLEDTIAGYARIAVDAERAPAALRSLLLGTAIGTSLMLLLVAGWLGREIDGRLRPVREFCEETGPRRSPARSALAALLDLGRPAEAEAATDTSLAGPDSDPASEEEDAAPENFPDDADEIDSDALRGRQLYVLVVNLFNQISLPADARHEVLLQCEDALEQVCRLYGGRQEWLPRTGLLVTLDALSDSGDHAFHAICAALLAQRVFADLNRQRIRDGKVQLLLRIGLERVIAAEADNADVDPDDDDRDPSDGMADLFPDSVARAITLSALARDEGVTIGDEVLDACDDPDRLEREALQPAALRALGGSSQAWLVLDLAPGYRSLLDRQAQLLLGANAD